MRIAILYGGNSAERDVSLVTGRAVGLALAERGHDVLLVDPARGDAPVGASEAAAAAAIGSEPPPVVAESGSAVAAVGGEAVASADVVFVALHGGAGEDGTIQGLLDLAGKRYTGSGVLASALAMDKRASKIMFREVGVVTPDWRVLTLEDGPRPEVRGGSPSFPADLDSTGGLEAVSQLGGLPVVVKPNDQGSTVGLSVVEAEKGLEPAIRLAAKYSPLVLMESFIAGRELTVAVLGGTALPVVEVIPRSGIYDYRSKYTKGMTEYVCPAELPQVVENELSVSALRAFASLGCRGYARVDYRLSNAGEVQCLEVNTVPGMTEVSLVPMAAAAAGITFGDLCERIVAMAVA